MMFYHSQHSNIMEATRITEEITIIEDEEDVAFDVERIGELVVLAWVPVI